MTSVFRKGRLFTSKGPLWVRVVGERVWLFVHNSTQTELLYVAGPLQLGFELEPRFCPHEGQAPKYRSMGALGFGSGYITYDGRSPSDDRGPIITKCTKCGYRTMHECPDHPRHEIAFKLDRNITIDGDGRVVQAFEPTIILAGRNRLPGERWIQRVLNGGSFASVHTDTSNKWAIGYQQ